MDENRTGLEHGDTAIEEDAMTFLHSFCFMRLGRMINEEKWDLCMGEITRMSKKAKALKLDGISDRLAKIRGSVLEHNKKQAEFNMTMLTNERVRLLRG